MSIEQLEDQVLQLPRDERRRFARCFYEHENQIVEPREEDETSAATKAIEDRRTARHPLPEPAIGQQYSGKFLLRTGASLQKALAVRAYREGKSLNQVCLEAIRPAALAAPAGKARRKLATA